MEGQWEVGKQGMSQPAYGGKVLASESSTSVAPQTSSPLCVLSAYSQQTLTAQRSLMVGREHCLPLPGDSGKSLLLQWLHDICPLRPAERNTRTKMCISICCKNVYKVITLVLLF